MLGRETAERADDSPEFILPAVLREYSSELGRDWIELQLWGEGRQGLGRIIPRDERARNQLRELPRIKQGLIERIEAVADRVDLAFVTGKVEQSGSVTSR
jgi:hypothetical protein